MQHGTTEEKFAYTREQVTDFLGKLIPRVSDTGKRVMLWQDSVTTYNLTLPNPSETTL